MLVEIGRVEDKLKVFETETRAESTGFMNHTFEWSECSAHFEELENVNMTLYL